MVAANAAPIGQETLEDGLEGLGIDRAREAQFFGALAEPRPGPIGIGPGVVIVGGKVAGSAARSSDIGYRQQR